MRTIRLKVNQHVHELEVFDQETLLEVLRSRLGLTGTKTACDESECGTCTVQINGKAILSCITLACNLKDDDIITIEGVAQGEELHPVQQAFLDFGAVQCGFCIPGMIMSAKALLEKNLEPSQEEIEYALDGNICRCAGYPKIFDAVRKAGQTMKHQGQSKMDVERTDKTRPIQKEMTCGITYEDYLKSSSKE